MKVKHLLIVALMMSMSLWALADDGLGGKNVQISVIPFGYQNTTYYTNESANYELHYGSKFGFSLGYEFAMGRTNSLVELTYIRSKYDRVDMYGDNCQTARDYEHFKDLSSFALMYYAGWTIFPNKRFQIPFYIGLGPEILQGYPFHNLMFDFGAKLRFKFYVSNRVGLFVGATGKYGFGMTGDTKKKNLDMHHHGTVNLDAGVTILFN
ncbi:MAG: hypothetical protein IJP59_06755 [Muribaculaceae bacterium]|nr:hypothetical protein [Muribaculaceae bacterium]